MKTQEEMSGSDSFERKIGVRSKLGGNVVPTASEIAEEIIKKYQYTTVSPQECLSASDILSAGDVINAYETLLRESERQAQQQQEERQQVFYASWTS